MRVMPGSHRSRHQVGPGAPKGATGHHAAIVDHGKSTTAGNLLSVNQAIHLDDQTLARAVDLELRPGEASVHHGSVMHGSNPNFSTERRCGLVVRYCPPKVRLAAGVPRSAASDLRDPLKPLVRPTWPAICVRGTDPFGHFGEQQLPDFVNEKKTV